jgi:putative peptidoglycan lipid II flippase
MVERFFNRISAPIRGLHQAAYVLALLTLASQALALLRDRTFAHYFGAGEVLDLYYGAFRVPDLVFALVASLVSAYVLIPRIVGKDRDEMRQLLSHSASFLLIVGGGISIALAFFTPQFLSLLYPTFSSSPFYSEFVFLTRLLLLQPIILGISGIITSVTQVHRRFILFALSPVLYNIGIIFGAIFLYPPFGLPGIGIGVLLGALMHAALHIPVLREAGVIPRFVIPSWALMKSVVRDSIPRSFALSASALTLLALTAIASRIAPGSISVFTLATNLIAVPLSLIGASYAVAAFPALSEHFAKKEQDKFVEVLAASARYITLWSIVFLGLIAVLRAHIVRVILGTGAFDWDATRLTAALLAIFAAGLVAQGLILLFSRAFYATGRSWKPLIYQAVGGVFTVFAAIYLVLAAPQGLLEWLSALLRVSDVPGTSVLFIALSAAVGQWIIALWSLAALSKTVPGLSRSLWRPLSHGALAALVGGTATYFTLYIEGGIAPLTTLLAVFTEGFVAGIVGLAVAAGVLMLLKNEEFLSFVRALRRLPGIKSILPPSAAESIQS